LIKNNPLGQYYDTKLGIELLVPEDFVLKDHQAPSSYYLRTNNTEYIADELTVRNNNRFISINDITSISDLVVTNDQETVQYMLEIVNNKFVPESHPKVLNKTVDKTITQDGKKIYYLERGDFDSDNQTYNELYVLVDTGKDIYYLFYTYTTFYKGNEITKSIIENSVYY